MEAIAREQPNQQSDAESQKQQDKQHGMDLAVPPRNPSRSIVFGLVDNVVEVVANLVHQKLAMQVEVDATGFASFADLGNYRQSEPLAPRLVLVVQIGDIVLQVCVSSCQIAKVLNLFLYMGLSFLERLQKLLVAGRLIAPEAGLLIHNQLRNQCRLRDAGVGILNQADRRIGSFDLEVERPCDHEQRDHRQQEDLSQHAIELT